MKKLLAFVLMVILCVSMLAFTSCDATSVFTAEEMLPFCDDTILTDTLTGVNAIELSADLYAVAFHNIPGDKVTIDYTTNEKTTITATVVDNKLVITQTCKPLTIHIGSMGTKLCLVVGIPESWTGYSIDADVDVGALGIEDSKASSIHVELDTGACKIVAQNATNVSIESNTGAVLFQGKTHTLNVDVNTGATKLEGTANTVIVDTDTGAIAVNMDAQHIDLSTDTGAINFEVINCKNIYVESDTGSIRGKIHGDKAQYSILVDVELGSCNVKDQIGTSDKVLEISNDTGSANIEFVQERGKKQCLFLTISSSP